jgi:hypothetical protein
MTETLVDTYYLRVIEIRTPDKPREPHLKVNVIRTDDGLYEETQIADVKVGGEDKLIVEPHGNGWFIYDGSSDNFTVWRRTAWGRAGQK